MEQVVRELAEFGLTPFIKKYNLFACFHATQPLCILTYKQKKRSCAVTNACRGIVVELFLPHTIVSRGFTCFAATEAAVNVVRTTVKEDGSLVFLFHYAGCWLLSTMHDFADNGLPLPPTETPLLKTYTDLFQLALGEHTTLTDFGDSLDAQFYPEKVMTYCFELCSPYNRIVRFYPRPILFLLAAFRLYEEVMLPPTGVGWSSSHEIMEIKTSTEAVSYIKKWSTHDLLFEGLVIETSHGERRKLKNYFYLLCHALKYRGWIAATPKQLFPILNDPGLEIILLATLAELMAPSDVTEIVLRLTHYKELLQQNQPFPFRDVMFHPTHPAWGCTVFPTNFPMDRNDGLADSPDLCYCGGTMLLTRLRSDLLRYKICPCGARYAVLTYTSGTWLKVCDRPACLCTHEVHQDTGRSLGIPASPTCKMLRLIIHEHIARSPHSKAKLYTHIGQLLEKVNPHMASMGITNCLHVLQKVKFW